MGLLKFHISCFTYYVLCLIFCTLGILSPAVAQSTEDWVINSESLGSNDQDQMSGIEYKAKPEVQSYAALCKAVYWERTGSYQEAKRLLIEATQLDSKSSFLYSELAEVLFALKEYRASFIASEKSSEQNPDNPNAHYLIGVNNLMRQERGAAIAELKKATELKPDYLKAQYTLASLLFEDEDYKGAAGAYAEMVKLKPYDPDLRLKLATAYSRSGQVKEAISEFNIVMKLRSDYVEPHFHLAYLYANQSKTKEAIEECLVVLKVDPGNPSMNLLLGELYTIMGEYDKAIARLEGIPKRQRIEKSLIAEAYFRLANAYKGKSETIMANLNFQSSIDIYKSVLEEEPGNIGVHYDMAMVYDALGDFNLAEQHLRQHIELKPDEPNAYNFLGYMFVERNRNLDEAISLIEKAVELEPQNGAFRDSLGWAYFKQGDLNKAVAELEKAVEFIPDDSEVRVHLGEVYFKKGGDFVGKALSEWERALEIKPGNDSLRKKLEKLRSMNGNNE